MLAPDRVTAPDSLQGTFSGLCIAYVPHISFFMEGTSLANIRETGYRGLDLRVARIRLR